MQDKISVCCFFLRCCDGLSDRLVSNNSQRESQHAFDKMAVELLSQADGYGIIVGLSVLFCGIILVAVRIQKRYLAEDSEQSEMFMVANRSVGTGLTCSAVFSSWM